MAKHKNIHVGLCGAGIGGLAAAIALRRAGAQVTVLEAASSLGEIGAGIQMTPNVSRLLIKWGVADVIGENLVEFEELNMRRRDGTKVGYTQTIPRFRTELGFPWWVVHRAHLHEGLVKVAEKHGVELLVDSRVIQFEYESNEKVTVKVANGKSHKFDLFIGSDGVNSVVRNTLFPEVKPAPPTNNCAYRAIVPCDKIKKDQISKELVEKLTLEVWMAEKSYIIAYPISGGKEFNLVLTHHVDHFVDKVEDVDMNELRKQYADYDPRIKRIVDMIPEAQRWPLLVTGPLKSWSSHRKNVVLMGDAAHSMVNHMAQGAATSMEDGAFLGCCIREVVRDNLTLQEAVEIYEKARMPKALFKQQVSYLNGVIWQLPDGPAQEARDNAMRPELEGKLFWRSPNLYGDPRTVLSVYGYDTEEDAELSISKFMHRNTPTKNAVTQGGDVADQYLDWFLPKRYKSIESDGEHARIDSKL